MLKEKLTEAINAKTNDINSFIWKYKRNEKGTQDVIRLVDATKEQLNEFYKQAMSMLYNSNAKTPGRYVVRSITRDQMNKCHAELFLREYRKGTFTGGVPCSQFTISRGIQDKINEDKTKFPESKLKEISISELMPRVPSEYHNLSIDLVRACGLDQLGVLNTSHISYKFIVSLGVFITKEEVNALIEQDERNRYLSKENLVKESLGLRSDYNLKINPKGLSYPELKSMIKLKNTYIKKYSSLTTEQLLTLRNKILFRFEQKVNHQIEQWEEIIRQIKKVAEAKGYTLDK